MGSHPTYTAPNPVQIIHQYACLRNFLSLKRHSKLSRTFLPTLAADMSSVLSDCAITSITGLLLVSLDNSVLATVRAWFSTRRTVCSSVMVLTKSPVDGSHLV